MKRMRLAVMLASVVAATACSGVARPAPVTSPEEQSAQVARGAEVYGYSCARCHNARSALEYGDRTWEAVIDHMRVRANLTGGEALAVAAFMKALNAPAQPVAGQRLPPPGQPERISAAPDSSGTRRRPAGLDEPTARGRELALGRGCTGCHAIAGSGGSVGPGLDDAFRRRDEGYIRRKILEPGFDNPNTVMPSFGFDDTELDAIIAYLRTLASRS